jgi:hypothetical protein
LNRLQINSESPEIAASEPNHIYAIILGRIGQPKKDSLQKDLPQSDNFVLT